MKEFIIFVCTDFTEIFSKLRSAGLNYNLPSFVTDSYCGGGGEGGRGRGSNKHCLLTFFISCYFSVPSCTLKLGVDNQENVQVFMLS